MVSPGPLQIERTMKLAVRPQGGRCRIAALAPPLTHFTPYSLAYPAPLYLKRQLRPGPRCSCRGRRSRPRPALAPRPRHHRARRRRASPAGGRVRHLSANLHRACPETRTTAALLSSALGWVSALNDGARPPPRGPGLARRAAGEGGGAWAQTRAFKTFRTSPRPRYVLHGDPHGKRAEGGAE